MDNNIDYYRKKAGLTVQVFADRLGITREYLQELKAGRKPGGLTVMLLEKMADICGCTSAQLISKPQKARLIGLVRSGGIVELLAEKDVVSIPMPAIGDERPLINAYRFEDDSNAPMAFKGWLYFTGKRIEGGHPDFSNRYYAVQILGGALAIRRIRPGRSDGRFSLLGANDFLDDIEIEWCEPVLLIEPA